MTDPTPDPGAPTTPADLRDRLAQRLDDDAVSWLSAGRRSVADAPRAIRALLPAATRRTGPGTLVADGDPDDPFQWHLDDAARAVLFAEVPDDVRAEELREGYRYGDPREKRGVLRALEVVAVDDDVAADLVDDAMRTNDTRLMGAALGPAGVATLDDHGFAQAVLKAVFVELDLRAIAGVPERVTPELSRMMADFVHERVAAGRAVPASVWDVIDQHPPAERLAAIEAELDHDDPHRARAAQDALAQRR